MKNKMLWFALQLFVLHLSIHPPALVEGSLCKWDVMHCNQVEFSCGETKSILLDAKRPLEEEHCIAIEDRDDGDYENYAVEVGLLSLESGQGQNSGNLGIIFNYLDHRNFDFIYLE